MYIRRNAAPFWRVIWTICSSARRERPFTRLENRSGRGTYRRPAAAASGFAAALTEQAGGQIDGIRQLSSVSVRIPHAVPGCADALLPQLLRDGFCSTLILSSPGNGKTTLLRECVRRLSDMGTRISLMDERGEIAAVQNRAPQFDVGANTDVMDRRAEGGLLHDAPARHAAGCAGV